MGFRLQKNGDQTVSVTTATLVTFEGVSYDPDEITDLGNDRVQPEAGEVTLHAVLGLDRIATPEQKTIHIYRDGSAWKEFTIEVATGRSIGILTTDRTDGTHYYQVNIEGGADADFDILGDPALTWFEGWVSG